jgi:hypothetical protein
MKDGAQALIVALLLSAVASHATRAEQKGAPAQQNAQSQPTLPVSVEQALYLIRATLLTLNDANRSGNYTVLRDLAAPGFQAKHTAADLAQIFVDLRRRNFDLAAVALAAPQLSTPPYIDPDKMLRLTGYFPTRPLQINFELVYQHVSGQWRLFGISVATPQAPEAPQSTAPPNADVPKGKAPAKKSK